MSSGVGDRLGGTVGLRRRFLRHAASGVRSKPAADLLVVVDAGSTRDRSRSQLLARRSARGCQESVARRCLRLPNESFDDIVYFGSDKTTIETLNDKLALAGIMNLVLGGKKIGEPVSVGVGRVHYGGTRWVGTTGNDAPESYKIIPATGEVRANDRVLVVGAGGPMGQMHVDPRRLPPRARRQRRRHRLRRRPPRNTA